MDNQKLLELVCALASNSKTTESKCCEYGIRIVVLQRGWVAVGKYSRDGEMAKLENAAIIRNWGTSKGLGQLAENGPTDKTLLDDCPTLHFHILTEVVNMECNSKKWSTRC